MNTPMTIIILGCGVQGLIAACLAADAGMQVSVIDLDAPSYKPFADGFSAGPVTHVPFALPLDLARKLDLEAHGLSLSGDADTSGNPFTALPFYRELGILVEAFKSLEDNRPAYKEKAWRDAWGTFELGRILGEHDRDLQDLFAQSTRLSLLDLAAASGLDDTAAGPIVAECVIGASTDPAAPGSAAAILPAMAKFRDDHLMIRGSLHPLIRALKQAAMTRGVTFYEGRKATGLVTNDGVITGVILDGEETVNGDYFVMDHDPVDFFQTFGNAFSLPPAFTNRVTPDRNVREGVHVRLAIKDFGTPIPAFSLVAPSATYVADTRMDYKRDGGAQTPFLSVVNVTDAHPGFAPDGHMVLDILAHYFDPALVPDESARTAVLTAVLDVADVIWPGLSDNIVHHDIAVMNSHAGQPNFTGPQPLLQLFRIFFGHHSIGYDLPVDNLVVAGYGSEACAHHHVRKGGMRVAALLHSIQNDDT